jgi:tritrans,polycis-undecaprenyl-diphosphate synthase [geranylgeranyl-diphosphate specific]
MGRVRRATGRRIDSLAKWLLKFRIILIPAKAIASSNIAWSFVSRTDRIRANRLKDRIRKGIVPNHVSIIMDGNRRFAWNSKIETNLGHEKGKEKLKQVMDWILDLGIPYLSVYALSTENIKERNQQELDALYSLYCNGLNEMAEDPKIHSRKVKVKAVGRLEMLPDDVRKAIKNVEEKTADYSDFLFTVCLAYGGREEIVDAVRKVSQEYASGTIKLEEIDTDKISSNLYSSDMPDPDLVIRTSGEERISNFLLWQIAYSELHFTDVHWPSFNKNDLYEAIESYQNRRRRYGG